MLLVSQNVTAKTIQKSLSLATGSPVSNKNLIHQATAIALGYDSYEQFTALTNRRSMIEKSLWVEICHVTGSLMVMAGA
jgi:hypothetical protein